MTIENFEDIKVYLNTLKNSFSIPIFWLRQRMKNNQIMDLAFKYQNVDRVIPFSLFIQNFLRNLHSKILMYFFVLHVE